MLDAKTGKLFLKTIAEMFSWKLLRFKLRYRRSEMVLVQHLVRDIKTTSSNFLIKLFNFGLSFKNLTAVGDKL